MEVENFLEMRLSNVTCESRYNGDTRTMTLYFETAANGAQGRDFFNTLSTVNLDLFSDICMEGQLGALELLDVTGTKRALTLFSPTGPSLDSALTPHYEEVALDKKSKLEFSRDGTPDMGSSSTAGSAHVKLEDITRHPPLPPPPATTVNNPVVMCDLLSPLDTDVLMSGRPSLPLFARRLPLSLKVHPDIEMMDPDAFKEMRILYLKHLDTPLEHELMWSFSFDRNYFPPWFLTK